ncbi:hypothetical protein [Fervidicola ferrireducens]|uniref:hypothetical protein n=1 Tax=Fervidicola ferrireducens TaxID=520764 RepID=UPI0012ECBBF5|nr:hypothetical protein [Fervidicola ferrireducens]
MITYYQTIVNVRARGSVYLLNKLRGITAPSLSPTFLKIPRSTLYKKIKQYNLEHLGKTE